MKEKETNQKSEIPAQGRLVSRVIKIIILVLIAWFAVWLFSSGDYKATFNNWVLQIRDMGWKGMFLFATFYFFLGMVLMPASMITIAAGYIFGFFPGIVIANLGSTIGATGIFLVGRFLIRNFVERKIRHHPFWQVLDGLIEERGFRIVILARLSLVMPFGLLNYVFSTTKVHTGTFFIASLAGMLPGTILYILIGSSLQNLGEITGFPIIEANSDGAQKYPLVKLFFLGVGIVASIGLAAYLGRIARQAFRISRHEEKG